MALIEPTCGKSLHGVQIDKKNVQLVSENQFNHPRVLHSVKSLPNMQRKVALKITTTLCTKNGCLDAGTIERYQLKGCLRLVSSKVR